MQDKFMWANEGYYRHEARQLSPTLKAAWDALDEQAQADYMFLQSLRAAPLKATLACWNSRRQGQMSKT
jgi:hypothetical protein